MELKFWQCHQGTAVKLAIVVSRLDCGLAKALNVQMMVVIGMVTLILMQQMYCL